MASLGATADVGFGDVLDFLATALPSPEGPIKKKIYAGTEHPHDAQNPEPVDLGTGRSS